MRPWNIIDNDMIRDICSGFGQKKPDPGLCTSNEEGLKILLDDYFR